MAFKACSDKGAVCSFRDYGLARSRRNLVLKIVPVLAGAVGGGRKGRVMSDVDNRSLVLPPGGEKSRNVLFGARVISRPLNGVVTGIDRLLDVDDQQSGIGKVLHDSHPQVSERIDDSIAGLADVGSQRIARNRASAGSLLQSRHAVTSSRSADGGGSGLVPSQ